MSEIPHPKGISIKLYLMSLIEGTKDRIRDYDHRIRVINEFPNCLIGEIDDKLQQRINSNTEIYQNEMKNSYMQLEKLKKQLKEIEEGDESKK